MLHTEGSKSNIPCCTFPAPQVRATFASDSRMWRAHPVWIWRIKQMLRRILHFCQRLTTSVDSNRWVTSSADVICQVGLRCDVTVTRVYVERSRATSHVRISELGRVELQRRLSRVKSWKNTLSNDCIGMVDVEESRILLAILCHGMSNANLVDYCQLTSATPNASDVVRMFTVPLSPATDVYWRRRSCRDRSVNAPLRAKFAMQIIIAGNCRARSAQQGMLTFEDEGLILMCFGLCAPFIYTYIHRILLVLSYNGYVEKKLVGWSQKCLVSLKSNFYVSAVTDNL
jgi:hypothetical protein